MVTYEDIEVEFTRFVRQMRKNAEAELKRLFYYLPDGVPVQEIEALKSECRYWQSIPAEWAEHYSSYICEQYDIEDMTYLELLIILDIQEWIQDKVETADLLAFFRSGQKPDTE